MQNRMQKLAAVLILVLLMATGAGCGQTSIEEPDEPSTPSQPAAKKVSLPVYYLKSGESDIYMVREVHIVSTTDAKKAALEELIKGVPETKGAFRVLPESTRIHNIKVDNGLATIDFSSEVLNANVGSAEEALGISSIVNTLTEFPEIERVSFTVNGKIDERTQDWWGHVGLYEQPFERNISKVWEPAIWVTSPSPGQKVSSPLTVTGTACVFEAAISLRLVTSEGEKLAEIFTTAASGAPDRGTFEVEMDFSRPDSGAGYLEVFSHSPKDGSEINMVRVPVKF